MLTIASLNPVDTLTPPNENYVYITYDVVIITIDRRSFHSMGEYSRLCRREAPQGQGRLPVGALSAPFHGSMCLTIGFALLDGFALIANVLSSRQRHLNLGKAAL